MNFIKNNWETSFLLLKHFNDDVILHCSGDIRHFQSIQDIKNLHKKLALERSSLQEFLTFSILPYSQIRENDFCCSEPIEDILTLEINRQQSYPVIDFFLENQLKDNDLEYVLQQSGEFYPDSSVYKESVRDFKKKIDDGEGCNFVLSRTFIASIDHFNHKILLNSFINLLKNEYEAYWIYLFCADNLFFLGATPEKHLTCQKKENSTFFVSMNPISGSLHKKNYHNMFELENGLEEFINDSKEAYELLMVTDEELKIMAKLCTLGGQIQGPFFKEMSKILHTEYLLEGESQYDMFYILQQTLFAPTVMGSPLRNAARLIDEEYLKNKNSYPRRYYSGAMVLTGCVHGHDYLDSGINIRMAEINSHGTVRITAGATIVADSIPEKETAETEIKATSIIQSLGFSFGDNLSKNIDARSNYLSLKMMNPDLYKRLEKKLQGVRNKNLSSFWIERQLVRREKFHGKKIIILDCGDQFSEMLANMLRWLGCETDIVYLDLNHKYDFPNIDYYDLVVLGPGPGNPNHLRFLNHQQDFLVKQCFYKNKKILGICLGHQFLCLHIGYAVEKKLNPSQGTQKIINIFGQQYLVGFYNSFSGYMDKVNDLSNTDFMIAGISTDILDNTDSADQKNHRMEIYTVHGLYKPNNTKFYGMQFHPESLLTADGIKIIDKVLVYLFDDVK